MFGALIGTGAVPEAMRHQGSHKTMPGVLALGKVVRDTGEAWPADTRDAVAHCHMALGVCVRHQRGPLPTSMSPRWVVANMMSKNVVER